MRGLKQSKTKTIGCDRCRTPLGVRGLKQKHEMFYEINRGSRTPLGVRGLKHDSCDGQLARMTSHPARGAWIETRIFVGVHWS